MAQSRRRAAIGAAGGLALGATLLGAASLAGATGQAATAPTWVTTAGKVVHLTLIAGWNSENAGFNFNGAAHGQMTITVPLGDTVDAVFKNNAQGGLHDALIVPYTTSLPAGATTPVFPGAASPLPKFGPGAPAANAARTFSFVASKAGTYMVVCGIAGHALAGMWDTFVVSPTATAASVSFGKAVSPSASPASAPPANTTQLVSTSGQVVHLSLIAAYNGANAGFNFDGGAQGQMTVTVPLGTRVIATFKNAASTPHNVLIVPYQKPVPSHSVPPAFSGACFGSPVCSGGAGGRPGAGGPPAGGGRPGFGRPSQAGTLTFTANKAGTYLIICGYPGHAIAGMWDLFVVSPTAKAASIGFKS